MRPLRYSINVTLDGCCDHRAISPDEDVHRHAAENLAQADALLFGRVTYELMEAGWRSRPRNPAEKAIVERFFGTFNTRLWSTLEGYVASNVTDRNPTAKAKYTPDELVAKFWEFIDKYNNEVHSETGMTPVDYWNEHCYAETANERELDLLLKEPESRRVVNIGIKHQARVYWAPELTPLVGEDVLVRAEPSYTKPDTIEVFYDSHWL